MTVQFISEVSSNHHQDLNRCLKFIDTSVQIGCDAVKFQLFKVEELFSAEVLRYRPEVLERRKWELPESFLPELSSHCRDKKILFGVTPFHLGAVDLLYPYVDFYKIASYELLWQDLLRACAKTHRPIVLSTGMATIDEIRVAVDTLREAGCCDLTLLHCVSGYPAPPADCNLSAIETLRKTFSSTGNNAFSHEDIRTGWSDHSVHPGIIYRAVHKWGADAIEFHLDLEGRGAEYQKGHCWLPQQIRKVIEIVRAGLQADGSGIKAPVASEQADRDWRADPTDGLRPMKATRTSLSAATHDNK